MPPTTPPPSAGPPAVPPSGPAPAAPGEPAYRRLLIGLFLAGVATFAQLYSPQGLLPLVSDDLGVPADRAALLVSASTLGLALSVVPWSVAGDRWGRRRAMVVSMVSASACALTGVLAPTFEAMLGLRLLEGMAHGGVAGLAVALLAEEVVPHAVAAAAGTYIAGTTLGGLSGRLLALPVAEASSWRGGMLAVTVVGVLCTVGFLAITPRARRFTPSPTSPATLVRIVRGHLRSPELVAVYLQGALLMGGFVALYNFVGYRLLAADGAVVAEGLPGRDFARHMLSVDQPDHTRLRKLVSRGFTPRAIAKLKETLESKARESARAATIATVGRLVGVPIDHFAEVSLVGFYDLAQTLGGVEVCLNNPVRDSYSGAAFPAGRQKLTGGPSSRRSVGSRPGPATRPMWRPPGAT